MMAISAVVPNSILLLIALCGASETKPSWKEGLLEPSMIGSVEALPVKETSYNAEVLSILAPLLVSECKKESTFMYPESHSTSTQGGSGVFDSQSPSGALMEISWPHFWTVGNLVVYPVRPLLAAFASSFVASLSAALCVPALLLAAFVGFVCGSAPLGLCPLLACFLSCVEMMGMLGGSLSWFNSVRGLMALLRGCCYDESLSPMAWMLECCKYGEFLCLKALMMGRCWHDEFLGLKALLLGCGCCFDVFLGLEGFMEGCCLGIGVGLGQMTQRWCCGDSAELDLGRLAAAKALEEILCKKALQAADAGAAAYSFLVVHTHLETSVALACEYNSWVFSKRAAAATAAAFCAKSHFNILKGNTFDSCWIFWGSILLVLWNSVRSTSEKVNPSFLGSWKRQRCTNKEKKDPVDFSYLQASILVEAYECVVPDWVDGHITDGSLSLGKGKASGRVDVPVGETQQAISLIDVNFTPLRRSPQASTVTPGSRVEKTVFVSGLEGKTKVHKVTDFTEVWEISWKGTGTSGSR